MLTRITLALLLPLAWQAVALAQTGDLKHGIDSYWAGDYSTAVATLKKFLDTAELRFDILTARKFLAFSYLAVDERERAVSEFEEILSEDPKYDITAAEAAPSALKVWKEVKQKKDAELAEQQKKAKADGLLDEAKRLFAQGQYAPAQAGFREVLRLDPNNQWARAYLEQVTKRLAETSSASSMPSPGESPPDGGSSAPPAQEPAPPGASPTEPAASSASGPDEITASPIDTLPPTPSQRTVPPAADSPDVWVPADAAEVKRYNQALRYNNSGLEAFQGGNFAAARNDFERAVQTFGSHPMFHWNLGLAHERLRREDLAASEYKFVIKVDPKGYGVQAHRQLGLLFYRGERWVEAARELEESLRAAPDDLDTRRYLARAYESAGNLDMAIQTYVLLVQQTPSSVEDRLALGNLHKKKGNTAAALAEFREVLKLAPNHSQAAAIQAFLKSFEPKE